MSLQPEDALTAGQRSWRDSAQAQLVKRLSRFNDQHGHLAVPSDYRDQDGYWLGARVRHIRRTQGRTLSDVTRDELNRLLFIWNVRDAAWEEHFAELQEFVRQHGHGDPLSHYVTNTGFQLGQWLCNIRRRLDRQSPERIARLRAVGARLDWDDWLSDQ